MFSDIPEAGLPPRPADQPAPPLDLTEEKAFLAALDNIPSWAKPEEYTAGREFYAEVILNHHISLVNTNRIFSFMLLLFSWWLPLFIIVFIYRIAW